MADPTFVPSQRTRQTLTAKGYTPDQADGFSEAFDQEFKARMPEQYVTAKQLEEAMRLLRDELRHVEGRFERRFDRFESRHDATMKENTTTFGNNLLATEKRLDTQAKAIESRLNAQIESSVSAIKEEHQASEGRLNNRIDSSVSAIREEHQASEGRLNTHIDSSIATIRQEHQASEARTNKQLEHLEQNLIDRFAQNLTNTKQGMLLWLITSFGAILAVFEILKRFVFP